MSRHRGVAGTLDKFQRTFFVLSAQDKIRRLEEHYLPYQREKYKQLFISKYRQFNKDSCYLWIVKTYRGREDRVGDRLKQHFEADKV